ncbi:MAG TPA: LacI family DNA-binding transcriptional regulator [bacterium]|nr:LacI family DNA-binding transcriptional regulator [bacterium]
MKAVKNITMQDIATRAGVTKATVSMVINNDKRITETTRQKVLAIVRELNYYPNESARKLAKGKTDTLAFVMPRFGSPFIASIMDAFERRTYETRRYLNGIQPYSTRNEVAVLEEVLRKILYSRKADAVVLLDQIPSPALVAEFKDKRIHLVLIETKAAGAHSVRVDNHKGAQLAVQHLLQKGRKRIGLIMGNSRPDAIYEPNPVAEERLRGYQDTLKEAGISFRTELVGVVENYTPEEGADLLGKLLEKEPKLDAVFSAAGDWVAMGVLDEARRRGIRVPEDLSLVGYDDVLQARLIHPPLTTIRQSFGDIASVAFDIAMEAIDGKLLQEKHVLLEPELVLRAST